MCLSRSRGRLSAFIIILLWYGVYLNPPGIYRSRGSTAVPSGTTTHTRFAHKILHYFIICVVYLPVSGYFVLRPCVFYFSAPSYSSTRLLLRNVTTPVDSSWFDFFHYYYLFSCCSWMDVPRTTLKFNYYVYYNTTTTTTMTSSRRSRRRGATSGIICKSSSSPPPQFFR